MDHDKRQLGEIQALLQGAKPQTTRLQEAMDYLRRHRADYHWVGIYTLYGDELRLGPYAGPETDHVRIPVGRGVCGTAVLENQDQIVADVRQLSNYLACNLETRSEIVILVREPATGRILGQIDVDGRRVHQFDEAEAGFLRHVAVMLAPLLAAALDARSGEPVEAKTRSV